MKNYLDEYQREMKNRNYSRNTVRMYSMYLVQFLKYCQVEKTLEPGERIALFLQGNQKTDEQRRLSWSAIKLFYKLVLKKECPYKLDRIRSRKRLPDILSRDEILYLLEGINNINHRLLISMLYGSGLRVSEVCSLKIKDLDFFNKKLKIRNSKGNKDRITLLSNLLIDELRVVTKGRNGEDFIFVTQSGNKYSIRTVQKIFSNALVKSRLQKSSTCHTLRHSFATHLVEEGVDIKTVKGLLGHKSIKTTMVYVQLADPLTRELQSPL